MVKVIGGETQTDGVCDVCKVRHRLIGEAERPFLLRIGFTEDEVAAAAEDLDRRHADLDKSSPDFHIKPSATAEARRERKRRSRAAKRAAHE